ncbi:SusC/RagA family TonB-linked outer membrane protein [Jiulongibacter sp. NS-SX5]|uniref:SusC/RagA family TonB-linked outer membrane protein n=1 Tax=Jiulongibacter sp. NS-SX5 TaxID=3463854 RepID=UPI00405A00DF
MLKFIPKIRKKQPGLTQWGMLLLAFFVSQLTYAQNVEVKGKVMSGSEELIGVSVVEKGTTNGTMTDVNGNFTLNVNPSSTLSFSYIGYVAKDIEVNNQSIINVSLEPNDALLDEVVVIGYGVQRQESVTGSVVSIKGDALNQVQAGNFQQALQGRAAGVNITTTSTRPGAAPTIRIRGVRSLSANNDPLIVLNGIPFSGGLSDINANDIASLDILKDASATAIYGSRGANGVIIITTKSGKAGQKPKFSYDTYYATKNVFSKYPMMTGDQLTQLRADVAATNGGTPLFEIGGGEQLGTNTDWQDLLYDSGMQLAHDISVQGGTENGTYNVGIGYFNETSVVPGDGFKRLSLRTQIDQKVGKLFRFGLNSLNNFNTTNSIVGIGGALGASPLLSPYNADGSFMESVRLQTATDDMWVPTRNEIERIGEGRVNEQLDFGTYNNLYGEISAPWVEGLKYRLNVGLNFRSGRDGNFTGQGVFSYNPLNNSTSSYGSSITKDYVIENQLIYDHTFADKHTLNFIGLFSAQKTEFDNIGLNVRNVPNELALWYNLDAALAEDITSYGTGYSVTGLLSYMGRVMYQYDDKYLITATLRSDGSSRLAPGNKWVTYPAVSVGWNIGNESFLSDVNFINQLKFRAGYGQTSNQAVAPYSTQGRLGTRNYNFGSTFATGYFVSQLPNPNLGWEFSETYNFGIDFRILNNRLSGALEYYTTNTNDILYGLSLPSTSGVGSVTSNIGQTQNKGFEITLNGTIMESASGFRWDAGLNLYRNKNEIIALATGETENVGQLWFVGYPINVIYDNEYLGLWNESDPDYQYLQQFEPGGNAGMIKVKYTGEYNSDGSPVRAINADDRIIQDPTPTFLGGFNTNLEYKNFDLNVVGTFQGGGTLVSTLYSGNGYLNLLTGRRNNVVVDYWTPDNTDARYPAPGGLQSGDNPKYASTLGYFDGSYLKIRALTAGYNLSQGVLDKIRVDRLRLYATVQNPFVLFSPYHRASGMDPETNSGVNGNGDRENVAVNTNNISTGIATIGTNVPSTRNFMVGLNVRF